MVRYVPNLEYIRGPGSSTVTSPALVALWSYQAVRHRIRLRLRRARRIEEHENKAEQKQSLDHELVANIASNETKVEVGPTNITGVRRQQLSNELRHLS